MIPTINGETMSEQEFGQWVREHAAYPDWCQVTSFRLPSFQTFYQGSCYMLSLAGHTLAWLIEQWDDDHRAWIQLPIILPDVALADFAILLAPNFALYLMEAAL